MTHMCVSLLAKRFLMNLLYIKVHPSNGLIQNLMHIATREKSLSQVFWANWYTLSCPPPYCFLNSTIVNTLGAISIGTLPSEGMLWPVKPIALWFDLCLISTSLSTLLSTQSHWKTLLKLCWVVLGHFSNNMSCVQARVFCTAAEAER